MSVMYCETCDNYIDTDFNAEHFTNDGDCYERRLEELEEEIGLYLDENTNLNQETIDNVIESTIDAMVNDDNVDCSFKDYVVKILHSNKNNACIN